MTKNEATALSPEREGSGISDNEATALSPEHLAPEPLAAPAATALSPKHMAALREGSGISTEAILARGYRTITSAKDDGAGLLTGSGPLCPWPSAATPHNRWRE
jgi:hypothetical protein